MPGAERPGTHDFARRHRVGERRLKGHLGVDGHVAHAQPVHHPGAVEPGSIARDDDQLRIVGHQVVDDHRRSLEEMRAGCRDRRLGVIAILTRGNLDLEPFEADVLDVAGATRS